MNTEVLVVGAGPTGLTLAIELLRRGIGCRIVEQRLEPLTTSRSLMIHSRTLELLDIAGIAEPFIEHGLEGRSMDYHFEGHTDTARLDFTTLPCRYPYYLAIEQDATEELLRLEVERLGGRVEWGTALQSLAAGAGGPCVATLARQEGGGEIVEVPWVAGCDGLGSTVRTEIGLPYTGDDYTGMDLRMMDVALTGFPLDPDRAHYFVSDDRLLVVSPLPRGNYRLVVSRLDSDSPHPGGSREDFQAVMDRHFAGTVTIGVPDWATVFRLSRRLAGTYRSGQVFLAGDAAHVHSPAGGQGMNIGMQDAFNLGWKLALVASGRAPLSLLDTYEADRRPVADEVLAKTHDLHAVIMAHGTPVADRIELLNRPGFVRDIVLGIAGLSYHYRGADTALGSAPTPDGGVGAGDRAPDLEIGGGRTVHSVLRSGNHVLLDCRRGRPDQRDEVDALARRFAPIAVATVDPASQAANDYGVRGEDWLCLVRPDGYIAVRVPSTDLGPLGRVLERTLLPALEPV